MRFLAAIVVSLLATSSLGALTGCAGSNASRAAFEEKATLSVNTLNSSAQRLVTDTVSNPRFKKFKNANQGKNTGDVVVRLNSIDNSTEGTGPTTYQQQLFDWLEQYFADNGVVFQGDKAALMEADKEDSDDFYDQSTGKVTTGGKEKSVLLMDLIVFSQERGGAKEWTLRAKFIDKERGVALMSASSIPSEAGGR
jgi:hypothetical protein